MRNIFKQQSSTTPAISGKSPMRRSHKKKTTYVLKLSNVLFNSTLFQACNNTSLPLIKQNGTDITNKSGWITGKDFPNPNAYHLVVEYPQLSQTMGNLAATVIEYYDKYTGKPVVQLYPSTVYIFDGYEKDYLSHLNHASRHDFNYQINLRAKLIDMALKQKMH